jgi:hypothetical protein
VHHLLRQLNLDYTVREGALLITTPDALQEQLIAKLYPIDDLIDDEPWPLGEFDFDDLAQVIQATIEPATWEDIGGFGSLEEVGKQLRVRQTLAAQQRVEQFLAALRQARGLAKRVVADGRPQPPVLVDDVDHAPIRAALKRRIQLEAIETPLAEIVAQLNRATGVSVLLDVSALEEIGIGGDTPVTHAFGGARLELDLQQLLRQHGLVWEIRDDALVVTTPEAAEARLQVRLYPLVDLLHELDAPVIDAEDCDYELLIEMLTHIVRPTTWEEVGGPASAVVAGRGCLAIAQTSAAFREIDDFFAAYRQALAHSQRPAADDTTLPIALDEAEHGPLRAGLQRRVKNIVFGKLALHDAATALSQRLALPLRVDHHALDAAGIDRDVQVDVTLREESLGSGLRRILRPLGLTWALDSGAILITPVEDNILLQTVKFYPVRDLLEQPHDLDFIAAIDRQEEMRNNLMRFVDETSWEDEGGPAALKFVHRSVLIVSQTEENHEAIADWLSSLRHARKALRAPPAEKPRTNAAGEPLFDKVYSLDGVTIAEAEDLAAIVQALVAPMSWRELGTYAIRPSMNGGSIEIRHTAKTHRQIHDLLYELTIYTHDEEAILGAPPVVRLQALALPQKHPANPLDDALVVRVLRLDPKKEIAADKVIEELRGRVARESWRKGATFVRQFRGQLIIRQTPAHLREIEQHLDRQEVLLKPTLGGGFSGSFGFGLSAF